ncbi:MAG: hypothetical protein PHS44_07200 [Candidatus Dojkabacteria bacterium]|jgi:ClpP class serine protease|nr:hypothetical protein [Candidatus Dojkabacteria bacterium]
MDNNSFPVNPVLSQDPIKPSPSHDPVVEKEVRPEIQPNLTDNKPGKNHPDPNATPLDTSKIPYWEETQEIIGKLENSFQQKVITLYIPMRTKLTEDEVEELYNHLHKTGKIEKMTFIIYGPGGSGIAAYRIVKLLRSFTDELTIVIPSTAASAMTMLALGGDKIVMGPLSVLSPIDTSIANHPLAPQDPFKRPVSVEITQVQKYLELVKSKDYTGATDFKNTPYYALTEKVHPLFLGTVQRSLSLSKLLTKSIAETHLQDEKIITELVDKLNDEYPTHAYPILKKDLVEFGLDVVDITPEQNLLCQELFSYYNLLSDGATDIKEDIKLIMRRYSFIESKDFRSYYIFNSKEKFTDGKWIQISSSGNYNRAAIAKNKKGYREVVPLTTKQFRKWIRGEEVELDNPSN